MIYQSNETGLFFSKSPILKFNKDQIHSGLKNIPDAPKHLYICGNDLFEFKKYLCVIGSRKATSYGVNVCKELISGLAGMPIVIVSGMASGIDSLALETAIEFGFETVAMPGSGLLEQFIYPQHNIGLAKKIIETGGTLVSEFEPDFGSAIWAFPRRNRLMAGLCNATLVIEGGVNSGTLITSKLALEYNRDVLAVPGSIFSPTSYVPNFLLKQGAIPVTKNQDILQALGFEVEINYNQTNFNLDSNLSKTETLVKNLLKSNESIETILLQTNLSIVELQKIISELELKGVL